MKTRPSRYLVWIGIALTALLLAAAWPALLRTATQAAPEATAGNSIPETAPAFAPAANGSATLLFVENVGQFTPQARYLLRQGSRLLWLTDDGLWLSSLNEQALQEAVEQWQQDGESALAVPGANIKLGFVGANPEAVIEPVNRLSSRVSYLLGNDPAAWRANVPVWGGVRYRDLYPGIDLVLSVTNARPATFPWHLEVRPGADLNAVQLQVDGAGSIAVLDGMLRMNTSAGPVSASLMPVTFQDDSLVGQAQLAGLAPAVSQVAPERFILSAPLQFDHESQAASPETPADIADLAYSTFLGGSGNADYSEDVAVDEAGAAYIAGHTQSADFPTTPGTYSTTLQARDAFVSKIDPAGNGTADLIYSTFIGGGSLDSALGIAVVNGQAHLVGVTSSRSFPVTPGAYDESCGIDALCDSFDDAFLAVLNSDGSDLVYGTFLGGRHQDTANAIAISGGQLYIVGDTRSRDFPTTSGAFDRECGSDGRCDPTGSDPGQDGYFLKVVAAGNGLNDLLYSTYLGGWADDQADDIAATGGDALIVGDTASPNFPVSPGGGSYNGNRDAYVMRISPDGSGAGDRVFGRFLGGTQNETGEGIDAIGGTAVAVGFTRSSDFPVTPGSGAFHGGFSDAYVVWLNSAGAVTYAAFLGGSSLETAEAVALDGRGGAIIAGHTASTNFPTERGYDDTYNGGYDLFVARMDLGSARRADFLTYSSFLGGSADDKHFGLDLSDDGYAYLSGQTFSADFPTTPGAFSTAISGTVDSFFSKLLAAPPPGIDIEKSTNGYDADEPTGPYAIVGSQINWQYVITNTGGFTLTNIQVSDDQLGFICSQASLAPDDTLVCNRTGTAVPDQYYNAATVTADAPPELDLDPVTDIDLSHYFGAVPGLDIEKYTNGQDADFAPGPFIRISDPLTWTFVVTNTGNVRLSGIVVTDSVEGPALCDYDFLERNQTATCIITATTGAAAGPYANTGYARATPPGGLADVTDQDDSHYFGAAPSVSMLKLTNDQVAHDMPGPYVLANDPVNWTYIITNTGNITVSVATVFDDQGVAVTCPTPEIPVDSWTACAGSDLAIAGQYTNTAEVQAAAPVGENVTAVDSSHYYGVSPAVVVKKLTNGQDVAQAPGPLVPESDPVSWTYIVTNTGNITLTSVTVTDDRGVTVSCDAAPVGPGQVKICAGSGTAISGQYSNTGMVLATPLFGPDVTWSDSSYYYGSSPDITVVKRTNGVLAESEPGPYIKVGDPVAWTYEIANSGNITLTNIAVTDNKLGPISCASDILGLGESITCQAAGVAVAGQYSNTVTAVGVPPVGQNVTGTGASYYYGVDAEISLKKLTNGQAGDTMPGPYVTVDDPVTWTFIVSNTGNSSLTGITLSDDQLGPVTCPLSVLASGQQMSCQVTGTATAGQHTNTATVEGTPPVGPKLTAQDTSHYFGVAPQVAIRKFTNGDDAPAAPGPFIPEGDPVTWSYVVSNTGNITLTAIAVTDNKGVSVDCAASSLGLDEATLCSGAGVAGSGQYSNTGSVTATPLFGPPVIASDVSHYYGSSPEISLVKRTNGQIARSAPGPYILQGNSVNWAYEVTNSGNITLTGITLVDNPLGPISCPENTLGMGQTMTCQASGLAAAGQYSNTAFITGTPPVGQQVSDGDISHYFGSNPAVVLRKLTNGQDAKTAPGPLIPEGDPVIWTYIITNTGNITLTTLVVTDSESVAVDCDTSPIGPGQGKICTASGPAVSGQYSNTGTVLATPLFGPNVTWSDVSHYYGSSPDITVVKRTNGVIARSEPGPGITLGGPVNWTYQVSNSGNITLTNIILTDDKLGVVNCPGDTLAMGEAMSCQQSGIAVAGQYSNTVTAIGSPPVGDDVTGSDLSHYYGVDAQIKLKKLTNEQDANQKPGPYILVDDPVTWTFVVSNTGNSTLADIALSDDQLGAVACPLTTLAIGQQMICQVGGVATPGQHANTATVQGKPPIGPSVSAQDSSHYYGVVPGVAVKKLTNETDTRAAPGPYILEGDPVSWTYIVTNTGNITLTTVTVTDSKGEDVTCGQSSLGLNASMTCTAAGVAGSGQYSNTAQVTAVPLFGPQVGAADTSYYFGMSPELMLTKRTNGQIARTMPGPYILVGDPVTWTFEIANSGNITLSAITLVDDQLGQILCPQDALSVGESMSCQQSGVATAGQYTNTATVTGTPTAAGITASAPSRRLFSSLSRVAPRSRLGAEVTCPTGLLSSGQHQACLLDLSLSDTQAANAAVESQALLAGNGVTATDISHYFGAEPVIAIKKTTNGLLAGEPPGPIVDFLAGATVTWTIFVSNTGNVPLDAVLLVDDHGTPDDPADDFQCDFGAIAVGQPAQSCTFSATAVAGQYSNSARVMAAPPGGLAGITNKAISYYFGSDPSVLLTKYTNGVEVESPPGPILIIDWPVVWTYEVRNTGNYTLTQLTVVDQPGLIIDPESAATICQIEALGPGLTEVCTLEGIVASGQYTNTAVVTGLPPVGEMVFDQDSSFYFGARGLFLPVISKR